ncbi:MAG: type IV secretory system conjugative DNA transfer family protein [Actinomycetota bacterium]|nr:type IV secretory system conjugative DNA transfer family protein [Actinomycetota bacterium]
MPAHAADTPSQALALLRSRSRAASHGLYLGEGDGGPAFAAPQQGLLVLGPPRSGKTSSVVVPNVLAGSGAVVAASTKPDLLLLTAPARSSLGPCLLFDPSGTVVPGPGVRRVGWSPLSGSGSFRQASGVAEAMVLASRLGAPEGDSRHWNERAGALLSVLFHAGALGQFRFREVVSMVDCREVDDARAALARRDARRPLEVLRSITATDSREQSGIWSTASSVLGCYRSETALESAGGELVDAEGFVSGTGTLYICAGSDQQRLVAPIVAGLVRDLRTAAYEQASARSPLGAAGWPPLLLALDELANIAPLHDLPTLLAEGAGQGVVTLACLQDLSQAASRWGQREADGFLSLFGSKLVFPGIGDTRTLEALSLLAGDADVRVTSLTRAPRLEALLTGRLASSLTTGVRRQRRLPVDAIARGLPGMALLMEGVEPSFVQAVPWFASPGLGATLDNRQSAAATARGSDRSRARGRGSRYLPDQGRDRGRGPGLRRGPGLGRG